MTITRAAQKRGATIQNHHRGHGESDEDEAWYAQLPPGTIGPRGSLATRADGILTVENYREISAMVGLPGAWDWRGHTEYRASRR